MRCIIIDDEPAARDVLEKYIADTPELELAGVCKDALEARVVVKEELPDLIFLDINMPRLSGLDFLKSMSHPSKVILTTAYSEYALEGYELDVIDYLLKPFSFERFLKAVDKAGDRTRHVAKGEDFINIKADGKTYRISLEEIRYVEGQGDYITVHTADKKLTFNETMKGFAGQLPGKLFARIHKSFLVNLSQIDYLEGNMVNVGEKRLPIGKTYKDDFMIKFET